MQIDFGQLIHALSDTVDLVGVDELNHSKRVALMARECLKIMGGDNAHQQMIYRAGLLHDCGVSSTKVHKNLVNEFDWDGSDLHCQIGADRMMQFAPLAKYSNIIKYHHSRWQELEKLPLSPQLRLDTNLIFLLDRVDSLVAMHAGCNRLGCRDLVCKTINKYRDSYFNSELVDAFLTAAEKESFWISQESHYLTEYHFDEVMESDKVVLDRSSLKDMALIFAQIVDAKSHYTAEHSFGVAKLAGFLAKRCGLAPEVIAKIEVAALLHDLGKLQIPDKILDFNGGLEGESLAIMRHHSYVTYIILKRIDGLEEITLWASNHHEKIDGSGYPFKRKGKNLSLESRIIMIADIFQALAQNRPYRPPMDKQKIVEKLQAEAKAGKLDTDIVHLVQSETERCYFEAMVQ